MNSWLTLDRLEKWMKTLWGITLFTLPVTSFRWLPEVMSKTDVRPMAIYSLAFLVPIMAVYYWKRRANFKWPVQTTALLAFILAALISTAVGGLYAPLDLRGQTYWGWAFRAWISLGLGWDFSG